MKDSYFSHFYKGVSIVLKHGASWGVFATQSASHYFHA